MQVSYQQLPSCHAIISSVLEAYDSDTGTVLGEKLRDEATAVCGLLQLPVPCVHRRLAITLCGPLAGHSERLQLPVRAAA